MRSLRAAPAGRAAAPSAKRRVAGAGGEHRQDAPTGKRLLPMCLAADAPMLARVNPGPPELVRRLHLHALPGTIETARMQATMAWLRDSFAAVFTPCAPAAPAQRLAA